MVEHGVEVAPSQSQPTNSVTGAENCSNEIGLRQKASSNPHSLCMSWKSPGPVYERRHSRLDSLDLLVSFFADSKGYHRLFSPLA